MKKVSRAMAFGLFGLCLLGLFVWWPSATQPVRTSSNAASSDSEAADASSMGFSFQKNETTGQFLASNTTRDVKASLHPSTGISVESVTGDDWRCRVQLTGLGRSVLMPIEDMAEGSSTTDALDFVGRVGGGAITEWFKNGVQGVEQGWTLPDVPDSASRLKGEALRLRLQVESNLLPQITPDRDTIVFHRALESSVGNVELRYQNLKAFDANGDAVAAWFELPDAGDGAVDIMVADVDAVYPLTIDPCFTADSAVKQFGDDTDDADFFGHAIAVSGQWAAVAAPDKDETGPDVDGKVYMFGKNASGVWVQRQSITTVTGSGNSDFGESVDIEGDLMVIGAPTDGDSPTPGGAHYIYRLNGASAWIEIDKRSVSNLDSGVEDYGTSVSITDHPVVGAAIAVGAPTGSDGTVFIYGENQGGTNNWGLKTSFQAAGGVAGFGSDVSIDSKDASSTDVLAVAVGTAGPGNFAYFFEEDKGWSEEILIPTTVSETIGQVVELDINENLIVVGAGNEGSGFNSVIIFSATTNGIWEDRKVIATPAGVSFFGVELALNRSSLAVYGYQAFTSDPPPLDFIFLYEQDEGGTDNWGLVDTISQPDLLPSGANDNQFGNGGLALTDDDLVVGAVSDRDATGTISALPAGAVYFFPAELPTYDFATDSFTIVEGAGGDASFAVVRTGCIDEAGTIEVVVNPGSVDPATFNEDYTSGLILVSFAAGESLASVDLAVLDDAIFEADESLELSFGVITGGGVVGTTQPTADYFIENDDLLPVVAVSDISVAEDGGQVDFVLTVTRASAFGATVDVATADGTAEAGSDYTAFSGTISIPAGAASVLASVMVTDDVLDELDETFTLTLRNGSGIAIDDSADTGIATITDDDAPSAVSIDDVSIAEDGGTATFTLTLAGGSALGRSVDFATIDGSAVAGSDYTAASGTVTVPAGATTATIDVTILDDGLAEAATETFSVALSNPINVTIADGTGAGTISDDDGVPTVSVADVTVAEDGTQAVFTLTVAGGSSLVTTVNYATTDGTATAGADYTATSGTATFPVGAATATVMVPITNDLIDELDETFTLDLSVPVGMTIADGSGIGTITDNDAPPSIAVSDVTVAEDGDTAAFVVTVTGGSALAGSVAYTTADGTATAGSDYTTTSGTLAIPAGAVSLEISVPILNDVIDELDEAFTMTLSVPVNVTISDAVATGSITDNDDAPMLAVADAVVAEDGQVATFVVSVTGESSFAGSFAYATADGTATAGSDYTSTSGSLTIPAGAASVSIAVPILDDALFESDTETFTLTLDSADGVAISDGVATGTITDNDTEPSVAVADLTIAEGGGTAQFVLTVTGDREVAGSVDFATTDGTAEAGSDYTVASGTIAIPAGASTVNVPVTILEDQLQEDSETFTITLSEPVNVILSDATATATITDNEGESTIAVADTTAAEGSDGIEFTLTVSGESTFARSVQYQTIDGTATAGGDYVSSTGTATIPAGATTTTVAVSLIDDMIDEADETFSLLLLESSDFVIASGDDTGVATITDDDDAPTVAVSDVEVLENGQTASFVLTQTGLSSQTRTVAYATADGTATAGNDYTATSGVATFSSETLSVTVMVPILNDELDEADSETFSLALSDPVNLTIADGTGAGTITDDDLPPSVSLADATAAEGASTLSFVVTIAGATSLDGSVSYTTADGTAVAGSDYTATSGTLAIPAGSTSLAIAVPVLDDTADESDTETFTLTLSSPVNVTLLDAGATGTITDNDDSGMVTVGDVTVAENGGQASFVISLSGESELLRSVGYATADGTATAGSDYTATSGTATFPAGTNSVTVAVPVTDDMLDEADTETFDLVLSEPVGATIESGADVATATITDNDDPGTVVVDSVEVAENGEVATFTITVAGESDLVRAVAYATSDGTAVAGSDYTTTSGTATFPVGVTTVGVDVPILDDSQSEADTETFSLTLRNPLNLTFSGGAEVGTGTITDDDAPPSLAIGNVEIAENGGQAVFEITVTGEGQLPISISYATSDGTATAGSDYTATSGTLEISADISGPATITVPILEDVLDEEDAETFTLTLTNPVNAVIGQASATGSILDNDDAPTVTVGDVQVTEGAGAIASFEVTLSAASERAVSVDVMTAAGTATADSDFTATSDTVAIAAGATSGTFAVPILDDIEAEYSEAFTATLTAATNATIGVDAIGDATILDDDGGIGATLVLEATSIPALAFEPDKSTPLADGDLIQVGTLVDTSDISTFVVFGELFVTSAGGNMGLVAGQTTGTFTDAATFTGKAIYLRIYNAPTPEQSTANGVFESTAQGAGNPWIFPATMGDGVGDTLTISTSDLFNAPFAGFGDVEVGADRVSLTIGGLLPEVKFTDFETGDQGDGVAARAFAVLLSEATTHTVVVDVSTMDGSAKAGSDYDAVTQTLVFAPGETEKSVMVNVLLDNLDESVEAFVLEATDVVNAKMQGDGTRFSVREDVLNPLSGPTFFGAAVALDADTMAVGSPLHEEGGVAQGAVFIFERSIATGYDWELAVTLLAGDGVAEDGFGEAVALNGNLLVVGAPQADRNGLDSGTAYLFGRNQGGIDQWGLISQLAPGDSIANDNFGSAVAVSGDGVAVAARFHDIGDYPDDDGAVYVFGRDAGGQETWGLAKKLTEDTQSFGASLAMDDGRVLVGARDDDAGDTIDSGAAFLYERNLGGDDAWGLRQRFDPSTVEAHASFGYAVALESEVAVITAFKAGADDSGSASVYTRNSGGADAWGLAAALSPPSPTADALFGRSVAVSGDLIAVGATGLSSVFVYTRTENPDGWELLSTLIDPSASPTSDFGRATAMWAGSLVTGLPSADAVAVHRDHLGIGLLNDGPATSGFSGSPSDPAVILSLTIDSDAVTILWESQPNGVYTVQQSSNMLQWSDVATDVFSAGGTTSFRDRSVEPGTQFRFYRIVEKGQ